MKAICEYQTIIFDCDGVILDSNKAKTEAFYLSVLSYGKDAAREFVDYHTSHGGVSRYQKFEYFLRCILPDVSDYDAELVGLLEAYQQETKRRLLECAVNPGLTALRQATLGARWLVASGGDQSELRELFEQRELASMFDGGIFGSPDPKEVILLREKERGNIELPALFIGDSRYDHVAASGAGCDFVFYSPWTEFSGWETYCVDNSIAAFDSFSGFRKG